METKLRFLLATHIILRPGIMGGLLEMKLQLHTKSWTRAKILGLGGPWTSRQLIRLTATQAAWLLFEKGRIVM